MNTLPDEVLLQVLYYLDLRTIVALQRTCRSLLALARDSGFWKLKTYDESRFESDRRRRLMLSGQHESLATLRMAVTQASTRLSPGLTLDEVESSRKLEVDVQTTSQHSIRTRALASWDPVFPAEKVDFYQDYILRHAPTHVDWLSSSSNASDTIGFSAIKGSENVTRRLLTAQDDGSVQIWDVASHGGRVLDSTKPCHLPMSGTNKDKETGAVDNVSVDNRQDKAYIAVSDQLHELDLHTLQVTRTQAFPFPITVLSEAQYPLPLTVGTNYTLHLFDPRIEYNQSADSSTRLELIGGTPPKHVLNSPRVSTATVSLEQPGPTSIVHLSDTSSSDDLNGNIWVAGRFTSLLNYDRRVWPKICGTLFSGSRLSSLTLLPHPYISRSLNLSTNPALPPSVLETAKSARGITLIGAGEYKGKGSLELYGIPRSTSSSPMPSDHEYRNRQTAAKSRLLSVATHGTGLVFSDGDGNLKWVERDGSSLIREEAVTVPSLSSSSRRGSAASNVAVGADVQDADEPDTDDFIQKLVSTRLANSASSQPDDLILWTGEGQVGIMGFGRKPLTAGWVGTLNEDGGKEMSLEEEAEMNDRREKESQERAFGREIRKALERQADEVRWMRGLGVSFSL